ncbi:hypothetical protein AM593_04348, partial [Mytilus galloprovincialis]
MSSKQQMAIDTGFQGDIRNSGKDILLRVDCLSIIPEVHRPDWVLRCDGTNPNIKNHRLIVDGPGSKAVFNGLEPKTDLLYTRHNTYISANWDGFIDRESGLLGYAVFVDDRYYISVRALNNVEYGGPLATTVCHSTPISVDNSPPLALEIYDISYNEITSTIRAKHNS